MGGVGAQFGRGFGAQFGGGSEVQFGEGFGAQFGEGFGAQFGDRVKAQFGGSPFWTDYAPKPREIELQTLQKFSPKPSRDSAPNHPEIQTKFSRD